MLLHINSRFWAHWSTPVVLALSIGVNGAVATGASFQGLGQIAGLTPGNAPRGISSDGLTVVGGTSGPSPQQAFIWTEPTGIFSPGFVSTPFQTEAYATSADGSVVVGNSFRWTSGTGMQPLPVSFGGNVARDISADGSIIVGTLQVPGTNTMAYRTGTGPLGHLGGGTSIAHAVSADGAVVVGRSTSFFGAEAYRWTSQSGMVSLRPATAAGQRSEAYDVSTNSSVVVGYAEYGPSSLDRAFRWTEATGMSPLDNLDSYTPQSRAYAVNADGSVIVGYRHEEGGGQNRAMIWDEQHGMRYLRDVLVNEHNLDLTGWTLYEAYGVSADGSVITGTGTNPDGQSEGWIAVIPEPGSLTLLVLGSAWALRRF